MSTPPPDTDANGQAARLQALLARLDQAAGQQLREESFLAVDATGYRLVVKIQSPYGQGESHEAVGSTNELQQRVNRWLAVQRDLGRLATVRLVITPVLDAP
jgi:hypothetical protein